MHSAHTLNPAQLEFTQRAEQELASFHRAVSELYGPAEAALAAEDWLRAFESTRTSAATLSWHRVSQQAAARLASRLAAGKPGPLGRIRQFMQKRGAHTPCFCSCGPK